jgi:hypothetical protein
MGWKQLEKIIEDNRKEAAKDAKKHPTICPDCAYAPLVKDQAGRLFCQFCGWSE